MVTSPQGHREALNSPAVWFWSITVFGNPAAAHVVDGLEGASGHRSLHHSRLHVQVTSPQRRSTNHVDRPAISPTLFHRLRLSSKTLICPYSVCV